MCRIAAKISRLPDCGLTYSDSAQKMVRAMSHGGPDDEGIYCHDAVTLGHRRLSIIELSSAGHQPMQDAYNELVITFNGEKYNYQELRKELELLGSSFNTQTDTEVILNAFCEWGVSSSDRLEAIFAFVIFDQRKNQVYCVRDHLGVKPLYYAIDKSKIVVASEVKAFKALDHQWAEDENWKVFFWLLGRFPFRTLHWPVSDSWNLVRILSMILTRRPFQIINTASLRVNTR